MPDWLFTVLSNPPDRTKHVPSTASSIPVVPSQPRLLQTPSEARQSCDQYTATHPPKFTGLDLCTIALKMFSTQHAYYLQYTQDIQPPFGVSVIFPFPCVASGCASQLVSREY